MAAKQKSFEDRLNALEELVRRMEAGGQTLDATLKDYEAGMKLAADLNKDLDAAEKKMLELKAGKLAPMEDAP
ncbi:MAG: exodeoxyribonuclease VII small subunit [Clostridia bacterium]|nr:exodeoxyribonuclease VII small subunit [Clostridia bacterium]